MDGYVNQDGTVIYAKWLFDTAPKGFRLCDSDKAEKQMTERINKLNNFDIVKYLSGVK
jgi:hypothetical protein